MADGALWVWVAETIICPVSIPVCLAAISLAWSISSRGIMQVSTTHRTSLVWPSSSAMALAWSGSTARSALRSVNMPLTRTGNLGGVMSTTAAPARNPRTSRSSREKVKTIPRTRMIPTAGRRGLIMGLAGCPGLPGAG